MTGEKGDGYMPGGVTGKGWRPGQSGNPGGRPRGESIKARLRRILEGEHNGRELMELLTERLVKEALAGKYLFLREVLDRLEGPVSKQNPEPGDNVVRIMVEDVRGNQRELSGLRQLYTEYPAPMPRPDLTLQEPPAEEEGAP